MSDGSGITVLSESAASPQIASSKNMLFTASASAPILLAASASEEVNDCEIVISDADDANDDGANGSSEAFAAVEEFIIPEGKLTVVAPENLAADSQSNATDSADSDNWDNPSSDGLRPPVAADPDDSSDTDVATTTTTTTNGVSAPTANDEQAADEAAPSANAATDDPQAASPATAPATGDSASTSAATPAPSIPSTATASEGLAYDAASVVVCIAPGSSADVVFEVVRQAHASGLDVAVTEFTQADLAYGLVKLAIMDATPVDAAVACLQQLNGVVSAQRNYLYQVQFDAVTADVLAGAADSADCATAAAPVSTDSQTAAASTLISRETLTDRWSRENWVLDTISAYDAWNLVRTEHAVGVAIIDTGVDLDHSDLAAHIVASYNANDPSKSADDLVGHGTHVAGIVAGIANNGIGVAGVSYNADIVAIKASTAGQNSFDTASIVRAYAWLLGDDGTGAGRTVAERYNVRVVNMSIGGVDNDRSANLPDDEIYRAMARARAAGILTVCAAGNLKNAGDAPYATYPGDANVCLSVMALAQVDDEGDDSGDDVVVEADADAGGSASASGGAQSRSATASVELSATSNCNAPGTSCKDVCAPGAGVYSAWIGNVYVVMGGTSMATPVVSGVAALLFAVNPYLTPEVAQAIICHTCDDLGDEGWDETYGHGLVNAASAVRMALGAWIDGPDALLAGSGAYAFSLTDLSVDEDAAGWTWGIESADGAADAGAVATVDAAGHVTAGSSGSVTLVASCKTARGSEIALRRLVHVVEASIAEATVTSAADASATVADTAASASAATFASAADASASAADTAASAADASASAGVAVKQLQVDLLESGSALTNLTLQWFWTIDALADGAQATIDAMTGLLTFLSPGSVTVRATCTTNSTLTALATYALA